MHEKIFPDVSNISAETRQLANALIENLEANLGPVLKPDPNNPYGLRRFNPSRSSDTQAFTDMDRHKRNLKFSDGKSSKSDIDWLLRIDETDQQDPRILFAVVDSDNKVAGWVMFYRDDKKREDLLKQQVEIPEDALLLDVSYVKSFSEWSEGRHLEHYIKDRPNLPEETKKGVAVNGLLQATARLLEMEQAVAGSGKPRDIYISAYTNPDNIASEGVLTKNGFTKLPNKIEYDGELDNAWIKKLQ